MRKKTVLNIAIMALVLSFFVTPLGDYSKVLLNKIFSFSPQVTKENNREQVTDYNWKLKDANWDFFNFKQSKGKVVFINFWRSWILPSEAELESIQKLYDNYEGRVDFYLITNEEREPVEEFMKEKGFTFPVTYSIVGDPMPVDGSKPPQSYLLDRNGRIVIQKEGVADWDNDKVKLIIDKLLLR
ncbi:Thiol-disulfide oxidoreductase ResA [Arenibacter antarcticus]|uniref:TlpA family protein disulfide reductase n=1 Tax=Arenibacter antarcticus TaxID=2040469 RepID=A0ABW5VKR3_9FLAO